MLEQATGGRIDEALKCAASALADAGCETPRLDAELLLAESLGVDRGRLVINGTALVPEQGARRFDALLARRAAREPVAYILGRKGFRHVSLHVDRRVLIPRPETELLVDVALTLATGTRALDVGTGSGAVALALKDERADLEVLGTDISQGAVSVARSNALRLGLDVSFTHGDLLAGIECDAVLANLPYVAQGETLAPEISRYEPTGALFAGADGLEVISRLVAVLPDGVSFIALEIGAGQADEVATLLAHAGFRSVERVRDLAGHERVVIARR